MKKLLSVIFFLTCAITMSAQMSHPVMIWQGGNKMTLTNVDSITYVQTPDVAESEFVDLGLSVKWAKCNLGATSESAYGNYYAWGETKTKNKYDWESYTLCDSSSVALTKYNSYYWYGKTIDGKYMLESSDDAATVLKGSAYRLPTYDEFVELMDNCTFQEEVVNNHKGVRLTGPNGNSIFFPMAGYRTNQVREGVGSTGQYWLGQAVSNSNEAYRINIFYDFGKLTIPTNSSATRERGYSIRPVLP